MGSAEIMEKMPSDSKLEDTFSWLVFPACDFKIHQSFLAGFPHSDVEKV